VKETFALALEPRGPIRHDSPSQHDPNLTTEIRLAGLTGFALSAL
jgi:hypothetical protein